MMTLHFIDSWLWKHNITDPLLRRILRLQILLTCSGLSIGLVVLLFSIPAGLWLLWCSGGAGLAGWNFFAMAGHVQKILPKGWGRATLMGVLLFTYFRLFFTGFLIYGAAAWLHAPLSAIFIGLGTLLLIITIGTLQKNIAKKDTIE